MRRIGSGLVIALSPLTALGEAPACAVPNCAPLPYHCAPPVMPESAPVQPEGHYVRGPESGEFIGPSESIGVRGFGIRLPEIRIDLPEVRLPHLVRYRRNPEMVVSESRAPFVRGEAMEFNQVAPESVPTPVVPESAPVCVPPAPAACGSREDRLLNELVRKEAELREMNRRFGELEAMVSRLAEQQATQSADLNTGVQPTYYEQPMRIPRQEALPATTAVRNPSVSRPVAPPPSAPVKRPVTSRPSVPIPPVDPASRFGLSSVEPTNSFGDWNGAAKR